MKLYSLLFVLVIGLITGSVQAAVVTFNPNPEAVTLGSIFTLDIIGTGFPESEGGGAKFTFDETILKVNSVAIDPGVWDVYTNGGVIDNANGNVTNIAVAAFNNPGTDFIVGTIEFEAVGIGVTDLLLSGNSLNPWASGGSRVNPTFIDGAVTVSAVPLPVALWLFGSGLFGLVGMARRKKA